MNPVASLGAGACGILMVFFLVLFSFSPKNREHLYLALSCGFLSMNLSTLGPAFLSLFLPGTSDLLLLRLSSATFLAGLASIAALWKSLYPSEFPSWMETALGLGTLALGVGFFAVPQDWLFLVTGAMILFCVAFGLVGIVGLVDGARQRLPDAVFHLVGLVFLVLGTLGWGAGIVLQTTLLSRRFWRLHRLNRDMAETQKKNHQELQDLNQIYSRFVPFALLKDLQKASLSELSLGSHSEVIRTVVFSDIRNFTALSESLTPDQTFRVLNRYLSRIGPLVREHGGFVLNYQGDAILAIFGPEAGNALNAAVAMHQELERCNEEARTRGDPELRIGVGIHTAPLWLGIIGERDRLSAAVISDAAKVAEELESLTKSWAAKILMSGEARKTLGAPEDRFSFRRIEGRPLALGDHEVWEVFYEEAVFVEEGAFL